jgi:hypothetical protein
VAAIGIGEEPVGRQVPIVPLTQIRGTTQPNPNEPSATETEGFKLCCPERSRLLFSYASQIVERYDLFGLRTDGSFATLCPQTSMRSTIAPFFTFMLEYCG